MDMSLSNEQLAMVATRTFAKLWMPRSPREALQPFQTFCCELLRSTQIAVPIVMLALLYVNRFKLRYPGLTGGNGSEYRMFVVALMLASKFLEDNTFTTQTWSEVSHLPARELAIMQRELLVALDHRLHVADTEYNSWIARLQTIVVGKGQSFQLSPSPLSAFAPSEVHTPAIADCQVVPPSPLGHDMPVLPSPPAKRMRYAATHPAADGSSSRIRPDAISIPTYSLAPPQMYTPPASAFGFARSDFTFNVPTMPAFGQHGVFFAHPHSAGIAQQPPSHLYSMPPQHLPSLATFAPSTTISALQGVCSAPGTTSVRIPHQMPAYVPHIASQQPALPSTAAAVAAASALATQYPSLCYSAASFGSGFGSGFGANGGSMPIYNYGA
ncbi:hypothetical protein IWW50_006543 [Coemansia erecta]|nr:hypothetical protein IWW50_006543 [Coemansia erecta]